MPENSDRGQHRDGKKDPDHARDFSAHQDAEQYGQRREHQLRAQEVPEHQVHALNHRGGDLPIGFLFYGVDEHVAELASVFEEEDRQDGHQQQPPGFLQAFESAEHHGLNGPDDFAFLDIQKALEMRSGVRAPSVVVAYLVDDLAVADALGPLRGLLFQLLAFTHHGGHRAHQQHRDHGNPHPVNYRHRRPA